MRTIPDSHLKPVRERLSLPGVTLCAATSVNVAATVAALSTSMDTISFGDAVLFTDIPPQPAPLGVRVVTIDRLESDRAYSDFVLRRLSEQIHTDHCLIVQWDGFVLDAGQWDPEFLAYDYIGAPWPQFTDGYDVGNGGFSLRSRRLLEACRSPRFAASHPEDVAIGRINRELLERDYGIVFAPRQVAERFAFERTVPDGPTFGFHGAFNMIPAMGDEEFWRLYRALDHRRLETSDLWLLVRQLAKRPAGVRRSFAVLIDWLRSLVGQRPRQA